MIFLLSHLGIIDTDKVTSFLQCKDTFVKILWQILNYLENFERVLIERSVETSK